MTGLARAALASLSGRHGQAALLPAGILAVVLLMVVPIPAALLDIFFVFNIALALIMLMLVLQVGRPVHFSAFPTVLLFATLFRLALNVASTRIVLVAGHEGSDAAGRVIEAFGRALVGGDFAVGLIVFLILVVMNLAVIARGAGRVSEVSARFTLDALPGKQMAIDADLNAGMLSPDEARARRAEVAAEADFHGAMDGASKFVKGDAVAGLVILAVNIVGGLIIGTARHDMGLGAAADRYVLLSVGDALVAQIPALLLSIAAAILVTRTSEDRQLDRQLSDQFGRAAAWWPAAIVIGALGLAPGLPGVVLLPAALVIGTIAFFLSRQSPSNAAAALPPPAEADPAPRWADVQEPALVTLEIGYGLIALVDGDFALTQRVTGLRRQLSRELGFLLPAVRIRDNLDLDPHGYRIMIAGEPGGTGMAWPGDVLALGLGDTPPDFPGRVVRDPAYGLPAVWIDPGLESRALAAGCTVVDPVTVLCTHLHRGLKDRAHALFGLDDAHALIELLNDAHPQLAAAIGAKALPIATVAAVCRALLEEGVPLRDFYRIASALSQAALLTQDPIELAELVRERIGPLIVGQLVEDGQPLALVALAPDLEALLVQAHRAAPRAAWPFEPGLAARLADAVRAAAAPARAEGRMVALISPAGPRRALWRLLRARGGMPVLGFSELPETLPVDVLAVVGDGDGIVGVPAEAVGETA